MSIRQVIRKLRFITKPIEHDAVFFGFFWFLISIPTLVSLARKPAEMASWGYLGISFLITYIVSAIVSLPRLGFLRWLFFIFALALFSFILFLLMVFGLTLAPQIMLLIGETNPKESSEFMATYLLGSGAIKTYLIVVVVAFAYLAIRTQRKRIGHWLEGKIQGWLLTLVTCILLVIGVAHWPLYRDLFKCKVIAEMDQWAAAQNTTSLDAVTSLIYSLQGPRVASYEVKRGIDICRKVAQEHRVIEDTDSLNVIFVLGESFIKVHSDLYGYPNPTTPRMHEEETKGRLFAFDNVISPYNITTLSEKSAFSCNSIADGEEWYDKPIFPTIFKASGYDVFFWDMQRIWNSSAAFTFSVNAFLFDKTIQQYSYTAVSNRSYDYDGDLIEDFFKNVSLTNPHNLVLFHLLGQHVNAADRYPKGKGFEKFKSSDIKRKESYLNDTKRQYIAEYDNAIYYNDYVLGSIIDHFRNTNALLVFFSDHGEEVYDYRDSRTRVVSDDIPNLLKYQFEVPFFVWCSDQYIQRHPDIVNDLRTAVHRPGTIDNACQLLFRMAHLSTPYYKAERDISSGQYVAKTRRAYGYNYDKYVKHSPARQEPVTKPMKQP